MNKKFLSIALIILMGIGVFLVISKVAVGENNGESRSRINRVWSEEVQIELVRHGKTSDDYNGGGYEIIIDIKNVWDKIITVNNLELKFFKKDLGTVNFPISGHTKYIGGVNDKYGIDPGETQEFIFFIPKEISFDETVDLNTMIIQYNINQWMFRTGERSLLFSIGSSGGGIEIKNTGEDIDF